jgi:putative acetyltransferase
MTPATWQSGGMLIRREQPRDLAAIDAIHRRAFAMDETEPVEVGLVRALRRSNAWVPALSLVAEIDGTIVGHVVATEGRLDGTLALGLGPIGVLPDHQHLGVGSALMHAVLAAADALGYPLVALVGDTSFYPRFGFVAGSELGVGAPDPGWGEHFQVRTLDGYRPGLRGGFHYAAPFDGV